MAKIHLCASWSGKGWACRWGQHPRHMMDSLPWRQLPCSHDLLWKYYHHPICLQDHPTWWKSLILFWSSQLVLAHCVGPRSSWTALQFEDPYVILGPKKKWPSKIYKPYWKGWPSHSIKSLKKCWGCVIIPFFEKFVVNHALSGTRGLATPLAVCLPSASKAKHPAQWPSIHPTLTSIVRCKAKQLVQAFHLFIGNPMALRKNKYRTQSIYTHLSFINMLTYLGCLGARSKNWIIRSKGLSSWAPGSTEGSNHNGLWGVIELGNSTEG